MKDRNKRNNSRNDDRDMDEPAHTTQRGMTSPKFGAAGSGGAENEPVTEQNDQSDQSERLNSTRLGRE